MAGKSSRRRFIRDVAAVSAGVGVASGGSATSAQQIGRVRGFDHVALPMAHTEAMLAFYRALGWDVAPAVVPPCGDLCFVWEGTAESLKVILDRAGAKVEIGPVAREGGRRKTGSSVYLRDPDGNLLEFMIYP